MHFEKLELTRITEIKNAVFSAGRITCQLSAASLYCYAQKYQTETCVSDGAVYIKQNRPGWGVCYFCPVVSTGASGLSDALGALRAYHAQNESGPFIIWGITDDILDIFTDACGMPFEAAPDRDWAEYVHTSENLIDMRGKRFHAKKNAVNQFLRSYHDFSYETIDNANIAEVADFQARLLLGVKKFERDPERVQTLIDEDSAISQGLNNYSALGLEGGIIRVDGEICAYAFGGAINETSFDLTFEKALREFNGVFQVLEQEMLKHNLAGYRHINREEDLGDSGLRFAKERLRPDTLLMKYHYIEKNLRG